ncbi:MAG: hypothetical protein EBR82_79370 [Caulobacteraceae bacterium]|nr:hypothetical protein [Caulobacteraceae bacterium]
MAMRWKMIDRPAEGNTISQWFAFWPITVGGETRWLEWVAVEYRTIIAYGKGTGGGKIHKHAVRFIS